MRSLEERRGEDRRGGEGAGCGGGGQGAPLGTANLQSDTLSELRLRTVWMAAETKRAFSAARGPSYFYFRPLLSHTGRVLGGTLAPAIGEEEAGEFSGEVEGGGGGRRRGGVERSGR